MQNGVSADIQVGQVKTDGGTQSRVQLSESAVETYAEALRDGIELPPIVVFHDGSTYWLADGFHRVMAAVRAGVEWLPADVRQGARREAILHSVGCNSTHGLPRSNEDKRHAVMLLLNDPEWVNWSDREIARRCDVGHPLVGTLRASLEADSSEKTYTTKHGTVSTMQTNNIGRKGLRPGTKTTEERAEEIRDLAGQGYRGQEIADQLGISRDRVSKVASQNNITLIDSSIRTNAIDDRRVLEETVLRLEASAQSLVTIKFSLDRITPEQAADWAKAVNDAIRIYKKLHNQLKEHANGN